MIIKKHYNYYYHVLLCVLDQNNLYIIITILCCIKDFVYQRLARPSCKNYVAVAKKVVNVAVKISCVQRKHVGGVKDLLLVRLRNQATLFVNLATD